MGLRSKKETGLERVDLLNSSTLLSSPQSNLEEVPIPVNQSTLEDPIISVQSSPKRLSSSPLKIRERINHLFSSNKNVVKDDDYNNQNDLNDLKSQEPDNYQETKSSCEDKLSNGKDFDLIHKSFDLIDSNEEKEIKEILKLRQVVQQQESEEREDTVHDCSSLYAEETYLNTIRNQEIMSIQPEENCPKVIIGGKSVDVPASRLFLELFPHEEELYHFERKWSNSPLNYSLTFVWNKWSILKESIDDTNFHISGEISDRLQLYETITEYKLHFQNPVKPFVIHVFRESFVPKKDSKELIDGGVIEFNLSFSNRNIYKLWKNVIRFVLDDCYINHLDKKTFELRQYIVGLEFILGKSVGKKSSAFNLILWIAPSSQPKLCDLVVEICDLLGQGLPDNIGHRIENAIYSPNRSLKSYRVFSETDKPTRNSSEIDEIESNNDLYKDSHITR